MSRRDLLKGAAGAAAAGLYMYEMKDKVDGSEFEDMESRTHRARATVVSKKFTPLKMQMAGKGGPVPTQPEWSVTLMVHNNEFGASADAKNETISVTQEQFKKLTAGQELDIEYQKFGVGKVAKRGFIRINGI